MSLVDKLDKHSQDVISGKIFIVPFAWLKTTKYTQALQPGTITHIYGNLQNSTEFMLLQQLTQWILADYKTACLMSGEDKIYYLRRVYAQLSRQSKVLNLEWYGVNPTSMMSCNEMHRDTLQKVADSITINEKSGFDNVTEWVEKQCKEGIRVICISLITSGILCVADEEEKKEFYFKLSKLSRDDGTSIILVTDIEDRDETFSSSRSHTDLWLEFHNRKTSLVQIEDSQTRVHHTHTLGLLKAQDGTGEGLFLAFDFDEQSLTFKELGVITKEKK